MARALVATLLVFVLSGCISQGQGASDDGDADRLAAEHPARTSTATREARPHTFPSTQPAAADWPEGATDEPLPPRPWWTASVNASSSIDGVVASFLWQAPAGLAAAQRNAGVLEIEVNATEGLTGWTVFYVPAGWATAEVTASMTSVDHERSSHVVGHLDAVTAVAAQTFAHDDLDTRTNWTTTPEGWLVLAAAGDGVLDVSVRPSPTTSENGSLNGSLQPRIGLSPGFQAAGAKFDFYSEMGSGSNVPSPVGMYTVGRRTAGVRFVDLVHTEPVAQAGELLLDWEAPWARWSSVAWGTRDNVGSTVTTYAVRAAGMELEGADPTAGSYFGNLVPHTDPTLSHVVQGDGWGADVTLAFTIANAGDFLGFGFSGVAFGASMRQLTGMPGDPLNEKSDDL